MRAIRHTIPAIALAVLVAACGGSPPAPSGAPSPSGVPSPSAGAAAGSTAPSFAPSASPSVSPAPSVTPTSVLTRLGRPDFTLVADIDGSIRINKVSFPVTGHVEDAGDSSSSLLVVALPNGDQRAESVTIGRTTWKRSSTDTPWVEANTSASDRDLGGIVAALTSLQDDGLTTFDGRPAHRFVTPPGSLTASTLGVTSKGISDFAASMALLVDDDSNLTGMTVDASWTMATGGSPINASMALEFVVRGTQPSIQKPAEPWLQFDSTRSGVSIGYPPSFTPVPGSGKVPDVLSLSATDYVIVAREPQPKGVTLSAYVKAYENSWKSVNRARPEHTIDGTMGSLPAVFLTYHMKLAGQREYLVVGLTMQGSNGYFVVLASAPGNESNANAVFDAMMTTFQVDS